MLNGPFTVWPHGQCGTEKNPLNNVHPHAKRRPRVRPTAKGGKGAGMKEYNPDAKIEELTRKMLWEQHPVRYTGNVQIGFEFHYDTRTTVDLDNLIKHVWDAMNGWWWKDDAQVTSIHRATIFYDKENPRTEVWITEIDWERVEQTGMMPRGRNWDPEWDTDWQAVIAPEQGMLPFEWAGGVRL